MYLHSSFLLYFVTQLRLNMRLNIFDFLFYLRSVVKVLTELPFLEILRKLRHTKTVCEVEILR